MWPRSTSLHADAETYQANCAKIFNQSMGARNREGIGLSYRPARLCSLESIHRLLKSLKIRALTFIDVEVSSTFLGGGEGGARRWWPSLSDIFGRLGLHLPAPPGGSGFIFALLSSRAAVAAEIRRIGRISDLSSCTVQEAVLRIHAILAWIRIRGSMPLTSGSGSGLATLAGSIMIIIIFIKKTPKKTHGSKFFV